MIEHRNIVLLLARAADASICPSDVARAMYRTMKKTLAVSDPRPGGPHKITPRRPARLVLIL